MPLGPPSSFQPRDAAPPLPLTPERVGGGSTTAFPSLLIKRSLHMLRGLASNCKAELWRRGWKFPERSRPSAVKALRVWALAFLLPLTASPTPRSFPYRPHNRASAHKVRTGRSGGNRWAAGTADTPDRSRPWPNPERAREKASPPKRGEQQCIVGRVVLLQKDALECWEAHREMLPQVPPS